LRISRKTFFEKISPNATKLPDINFNWSFGNDFSVMFSLGWLCSVLKQRKLPRRYLGGFRWKKNYIHLQK
jgi:hypothetical protein